MGVFGILGEPGPATILIILMLGVLLFGKRLPEIGKNIGKGLLDLKKEMNNLHEAAKTKEEKREPKTIIEESTTDDAPKFESPE